MLGVEFTNYSTTDPVTYKYPATNTGDGLTKSPFNITTPLDRRARITATNGRESFTFTHNLMSDISSATTSNPPDVAEYTFTVRITNTAGDTKTITIVQQPPLMIKNERNTGGRWDWGYVWVNGRNNERSQYTTTDYGGVNHEYIDGSGNDNDNPNMYIISTSVAPSSAVIGDPRGSDVDYIGATDFNWTHQSYRIGSTGNKNRLQFYYSANVDTKTMISPQFRVASSYGAVTVFANFWSGTYTMLTFQQSKRRCATYQEDGIPAGRW